MSIGVLYKNKSLKKGPFVPKKPKLTNFMGMMVTLGEMPSDSACPNHLLEIGKQYRVLFVNGSCLVIDLGNNETAHIYHGRFRESPAFKKVE